MLGSSLADALAGRPSRRTLELALAVQLLNTLDIVFALCRWTAAKPVPAIVQAASRLISVHTAFHHSHHAVLPMVAAWAVADSVRFLYYCVPVASVGAARYSWWLLLYPVGFSSEMLLLALAASGPSLPHSCLLLVWPFGFAKMYSHMWGQRRRYLLKNKSN